MSNGGSISRTVAGSIINAIIVLFFASALMSAIFVAYGTKDLIGIAQEEIQARIQALSRQGRPYNYTQIKMLVYEKYGLNKPAYYRVLKYVKDTFLLKFGSFPKRPDVTYPRGGDNAAEVVKRALVPTIILFFTAEVIVILIGIYLGFQAARKAGSLYDKTISVIAMISASLPMWWVGMLMLYAFAYKYKVFPLASIDVYNALGKLHREYLSVLAQGFLHNPLGYLHYSLLYLKVWLYYMALPLITVILVLFGGWAYIIRNIVINVLTEDFVMVLRAKGVPERSVLYKHVFRAASPPLVTMSALGLVGALGGAIITEIVFQWPGMGFTYWIALNNGDDGVLVAQTYLLVFIFVIVITILDFLYMLLDPRVRIGGRRT
jgi:peptide/nickel transport system permease protein